MKKYLRIFTLLANLFFLNVYILKGDIRHFEVVIDVIVHYAVKLPNGNARIEIFKDGLNSTFSKEIDYLDVQIDDSVTRITIPIPQPISYIRLGIFFDRLEGSQSLIDLHVGNNLFIAEDGDTVKLHLYPRRLGEIMFEGINAQKYNLQYAMSNQRKFDKNTNIRQLELLNQNRFEDLVAFRNHWADSLSSGLNVQVENSPIHPDVKKMLVYDNIAFAYNANRAFIESFLEDRSVENNTSRLNVTTFTEARQFLQEKVKVVWQSALFLVRYATVQRTVNMASAK